MSVFAIGLHILSLQMFLELDVNIPVTLAVLDFLALVVSHGTVVAMLKFRFDAFKCTHNHNQ